MPTSLPLQDRRYSSLRFTVTLLVTLLIVASDGVAWAAGNAHHLYMGDLAAGYVQNPDLKQILAGHKQDLWDGQVLPDGGYGDTSFRNEVSETLHWVPFRHAYMMELLNSGCDFSTAAAATYECKANLAYFLGMVGHGIQDEIYDPIFMERTTVVDGNEMDDMDGDLILIYQNAIPSQSFNGNTLAHLWIDSALSSVGTGASTDDLLYMQQRIWWARQGENALAPMWWPLHSNDHGLAKHSLKEAHGGSYFMGRVTAHVFDYYYNLIRNQSVGSAKLTLFPGHGEVLDPTYGSSYMNNPDPNPAGRINIVVDRPVQTATVNTASLTVTDSSGNPVEGWFYVPKGGQLLATHILIFQPTYPASLQGQKLTVTITQAVKDAFGQPLFPDNFSYSVHMNSLNYTVMRSHTGYYARADRGGYGGAYADVQAPQRHERFSLVEAGGNQVGIRSALGSFLKPEAGGGSWARFVGLNVDELDSFTVIPKGDDQVALRCANGTHYVQATNGGGSDMQCKGSSPGAYETFKLTMVGELLGGSGGGFFNDDVYIPFDTPVSRLTLRTGSWVDRVEISYKNGTVHGHGGSAGSARTLYLGDGEYLNKMYACTNGNYVTYLKFTTQLGQTLDGGVQGGTCRSYTAPKGHYIAGFSGRSGAYVDRLAAIYKPFRFYAWRAGEPSNGGGSENCAEYMSSSRNWNDAGCTSKLLPFACRSDHGGTRWTISSGWGNWGEFPGQCPYGYSFAAPRDQAEHDAFLNDIGHLDSWINLTDEGAEGKWSTPSF